MHRSANLQTNFSLSNAATNVQNNFDASDAAKNLNTAITKGVGSGRPARVTPRKRLIRPH